jgi:hypothetical protein
MGGSARLVSRAVLAVCIMLAAESECMRRTHVCVRWGLHKDAEVMT